MSITQQPDALNLEEFRAKVTHAAREPLLARIAELESQFEAIGAGGVEPLRKRASTADVVVADERDAFDKWLRIKPCGAAHDFGWQAWKARAALASTPVAGELATLQAGLQAAAPNAPLYDPREVAFSAQAAPQAVHPENIREGAPYGNPEFEQLARDIGVWGTAQSAVCARFWLAATQPAAQGMDAQTLKHISALSELVRMSNAEHFSDAHNAAARHLRSLADTTAAWVRPVSELLGHISDVLPDNAFDKIDTVKWNAVSALVGATTQAAAALILAEIERMDRSFSAQAKKGAE